MDQVVVPHAYSPPEFDSVKQLANATARVVRVRFRWSCAATEMANLVCCILAPCSLEAFVFAQPFSARRRDGFDSLGSFFIQVFVHSDVPPNLAFNNFENRGLVDSVFIRQTFD
jgi:hypothetical protein